MRLICTALLHEFIYEDAKPKSKKRWLAQLDIKKELGKPWVHKGGQTTSTRVIETDLCLSDHQSETGCEVLRQKRPSDKRK